MKNNLLNLLYAKHLIIILLLSVIIVGMLKFNFPRVEEIVNWFISNHMISHLKYSLPDINLSALSSEIAIFKNYV